MKQFLWFDCLRCVAVVLVILAHAGDFSHVMPAPFAVPFADLQLIAWVGVDLFFVLSGFLVSGLLFVEHDQRGTLDIKRFLVRRAFKIVPPFYFLVLVKLAYDFLHSGGINVVHLFHDVFFLQSYRLGGVGYAWTLAVEVHFYILLALLLNYLSTRPPKMGGWLTRLPRVIVGILIACLLARLINSGLRHGFNAHREIWPTHLHMDVLAAGVLLRYCFIYHREFLVPFERHKWAWVGLGLLLVFPSEYLFRPHPPIVTALIPTCNYLGFALILFEATQLSFPTSGPLNWLVQPLDYIGKHSYSIYLWHIPVKEWLAVPLCGGQPGWPYFLLFVGGSIAVGIFFSVALEMPVLHLRNRLFPSRAREVRPAAARLEPAG